MRTIGFDNEAYLKRQAEGLMERARAFGNKLYLEFGGKLMFDYHAARVLPGYDPNVKLRLLRSLGDKAEIILCVYAEDIERKKMRADFGISYDDDALKLIDSLRAWGIHVCAVVITRFDGQPAAIQFRNKLEARGVTVKLHRAVPGYPSNLDLVVSPEGYGANAYVETTRPIVVVTGPGPGSGKLATCLTMLYHDRMAGRPAGYAKFETFPVWDLPLKHPVNLAYEAATADLGDINMIDPFHLEAYGKVAVNYNRDVEAFPLLREIWARLDRGGDCPYKSPTDMGVNMAGFGIVDDEACRFAARQEIVRRFYKTACDYKTGNVSGEAFERIKLLMNENKIAADERACVKPALDKAEKSSSTAVAIELEDGRFVTGKSGKQMTACAGAVLNAVKALSGIADGMLLLSPVVLAPIISLKKEVLREDKVKLSLADVLTALSICAATNPIAEQAMNMLVRLSGCEAHGSCILPEKDLSVMRKLGVNITCEPEFGSKDLYGF